MEAICNHLNKVKVQRPKQWATFCADCGMRLGEYHSIKRIHRARKTI